VQFANGPLHKGGAVARSCGAARPARRVDRPVAPLARRDAFTGPVAPLARRDDFPPVTLDARRAEALPWRGSDVLLEPRFVSGHKAFRDLKRHDPSCR
jgi:hypothetical protein